jgi:hypothetical protein
MTMSRVEKCAWTTVGFVIGVSLSFAVPVFVAPLVFAFMGADVLIVLIAIFQEMFKEERSDNGER